MSNPQGASQAALMVLSALDFKGVKEGQAHPLWEESGLQLRGSQSSPMCFNRQIASSKQLKNSVALVPNHKALPVLSTTHKKHHYVYQTTVEAESHQSTGIANVATVILFNLPLGSASLRISQISYINIKEVLIKPVHWQRFKNYSYYYAVAVFSNLWGTSNERNDASFWVAEVDE